MKKNYTIIVMTVILLCFSLIGDVWGAGELTIKEDFDGAVEEAEGSFEDGLLLPEAAQGDELCGIENCHGLDMTCGPDVPEMCTSVYLLGDRCRAFFHCELVEGECQPAENDDFEICKSCVEECLEEFEDDPAGLFSCEEQCGDGESRK